MTALRWPVPAAHPRLRRGEVHVWATKLDLPALAAERLAGTLSPDEAARAGRLRAARDRDRYIAARGSLRTVLARYLDADPAALRFDYGANGKPRLAGGGDAPLRFNLSHADELALIAVGRDAELGVDVERVRPLPGADAVAARVFPPTELSRWRALPEAERPLAFFTFWTRIEARLKARGSGIWKAPSLDDAAESLHELHPADDFVAALAVLGETRVELRTLALGPRGA
ncbi:MAG TPA: 4'-phosphopantetheinyl transferase superfamily protein [Longimicrobiales bacterium]